MQFILLRYGELGLKGNNRFLFVRQLRHNVRATLKANNLSGEVISKGQRIYVYTDEVDQALTPLTRVFGLVSLSPAVEVARDQQVINQECIRQARKAGVRPGITYRVRARRADKSYPFTSPEISRYAGEAVHAETGGVVDLTENASITIGVEITAENAVVYGQTLPGPGGLPVGTEGRVVALLSGGIDSPVAAWLMLKRGCGVIPLHMSSSEAELEKVNDLVRQLQSYAYGWQLRPTILNHAEHVRPALERLHTIREERWSCLFCKRVMLQQAANLARTLGAQAIVTGDSLGQVASQTLANIALISQGIELPILRPLIGMDKTEIMAVARQIGTMDISIRTSSVCEFLPAHPVTRGTPQQMERILAQLEGRDSQL